MTETLDVIVSFNPNKHLFFVFLLCSPSSSTAMTEPTLALGSSHESPPPPSSEIGLSNILSGISDDAYSPFPYYIHRSDSPGTVLVSKVHTGDNYYNWSCAMLMTLNAKKKLGFIDDIFNSINNGVSAHDDWFELRERFSQSQASRIFELSRCIATLQHDNSSILTYFSKLKSYWDELSYISAIPPCSCGASKSTTYEHQQRLMQFLMGLNDSYN
ncbi:uncharacterized protein LOC105420367 [Amborella trichopoda]|uniref:uncharacterized protein LOC105420367 n=1 Tax=Amborella trichopoda TaxID=13333 RepID=UPI0005D417D6|nr:uncharacterized protein LOC105420367 [Amborella trichopoda]|eukprot:XP_011622071.1 uncharacterized protein LOC105420367 [Amborella trichopoda]